MKRSLIGRILRTGVVTLVFASGFVCGSLAQRDAGAQLKELEGAATKQAGESGGAGGSVMQLGTSIVEMQDHLTALQKNLDTLRKVKSALGG